MYPLATKHFVTDRQTNRRTDDSIIQIADPTECSSMTGKNLFK